MFGPKPQIFGPYTERKGRLQKKKSQTWDIVPTGGEGVRHPELSVPTSLCDLIPKIDLNCLVSQKLKKIFFSKGCTKIRLFYLSAKMLCIQDVWTRNHIFSLFLPSLIPYQSTPWQPILGAHNLTMWPSAHNLTLQWMGPNPWQAQPNPMLHEI